MFKKVISILCMAAFLTGCGHKGADNSSPQEFTLTDAQEKEAELAFARAEKDFMDVTISIPAEFKAIQKMSSIIYMPVDGKVLDVPVEQGQVVKVGQALAVIQSDYLGQIQSDALQSLIQTDGDIKIASLEQAASKNAYEREQMLLEKKVTSLADFETARKQYQQAQAGLNAAIQRKNATISVYKQRLSLYGCGSEAINILLTTRKIHPYLTIRSNKNGVILSRSVNPEEFVFANNEVFQVADLSKVWLIGHVFDKDIANVKIGNKVSAEAEDLYNVQGTITYVAHQINPETRALEVRAEVENKDHTIKPNLFAQMLITTGEKEALKIPKEAVQKYGEMNLVFVRTKPNTYEERIVEIGDKNDKFVEVTSGLSEGDEVVTNGSFFVLGEHVKKIEGKQ